MESVCYTNDDKTSWGGGPWLNEPDHIEDFDEATGLPILMNRNRMGAWCGYVGVPPGHPLHGKTDRQWTQASSKAWMVAFCKLREKYGPDWVADMSFEDQAELDGIHETHPDYDQTLYELRCHGGVTYTGDGCTLSEDAFQRWRENMLCAKSSIEQYPNGDAAESWRDEGHLIDDYEGWRQHFLTRTIHHEQAEGYWFIGFDCSHSGDLSPKMESILNKIPGHVRAPQHDPPWGPDTYKTVGYVLNQCRRLAKQIDRMSGEMIRVAIFRQYKSKRQRYRHWRVTCERISAARRNGVSTPAMPSSASAV